MLIATIITTSLLAIIIGCLAILHAIEEAGKWESYWTSALIGNLGLWLVISSMYQFYSVLIK